MAQTAKESSSRNKNSQLSRKTIHHLHPCYPIVPAHSINSSGRHYGATPLLETDEFTEVDHKARRRWYLAYTLQRNPQLIELRRGPAREYLQTTTEVNSKNVDLKLTSGTSLTEHSHI